MKAIGKLWSALEVLRPLFETDQRATYRKFEMVLYFLKKGSPVTSEELQKECRASQASVSAALKELRLGYGFVEVDNNVKPPLYSLTSKGESLRGQFEGLLKG